MTRKNEPKRIKRVAALHDLSGFGRCALTVVIPTLSAMGIQVVPLPTALLSTHTGGFTGMYFEDLSHAIRPISEHWRKLNVKFDALYSGFLSGASQAQLIAEFFGSFATDDNIVLVDPAFADDGKIYSTLDAEIIGKMAELCERADIITPNITEACMLCGEKYLDTAGMSAAEFREYTDGLLNKLHELGPSRVVITGINVEGDVPMISTAGIDKTPTSADGMPFYMTLPRIGAGYPGTGELFASVMLGKLLSGATFTAAIGTAAAFTRDVIDYSLGFDGEARDGVALEPCLSKLVGY